MSIADQIFERCRGNAIAFPKGLAEILEQLIWAMDDNGTEILVGLEKWLLSDDVNRVRVALEVQDVFPFRVESEMNAALEVVKAHWPELTSSCERLSMARAEHWGNHQEPGDACEGIIESESEYIVVITWQTQELSAESIKFLRTIDPRLGQLPAVAAIKALRAIQSWEIGGLYYLHAKDIKTRCQNAGFQTEIK